MIKSFLLKVVLLEEAAVAVYQMKKQNLMQEKIASEKSKKGRRPVLQCHPKQTVFFQPYAHMKNNHFMSQYL